MEYTAVAYRHCAAYANISALTGSVQGWETAGIGLLHWVSDVNGDVQNADI
jgi:hypothetical protein